MQHNKDKINVETAKGRFLFFYPRTPEAAEDLLRKLRAAGFSPRAKSSTPLTPEGMIEKGVGVLDGEFFCAPNRSWNGAPLGNWLCTAEQLDAGYLPPDQRLMMDLFNRLNARIDELAEKIDRIERHVIPQDIEKPGLRRPTGRGGRKP